MSNAKDVIVVGGGINGVSTAYHLALHGFRVTLVEKSFIAGGPTGWSSAIIRQHYSNPVTARMALKSLEMWKNFAEVVGGQCGYTQTGFLVAVRPQDIAGLKDNIEMQRSVGIDTQFVPPEEISEIEPHIDPTGLGGFAYEPDGGYCDPAAAANAFAQAAQQKGTRLQVGVTVTGIRTQAGRVVGVETDQGSIPAAAVVVAAGPWSGGLFKALGIELPIVSARVKIGLYRRPEDFGSHRVLGDFVNQIYLRPETGGLMLVGSISPDEADDQVADPDHFKEKVEFDILADFAERAAHRYPAMSRAHLASNYASLYDVTPDWHAIMDAVPGIEGLYLCAGSSGHGFKLAPAVGEMMARLVIHGKKPGDDIDLFAFDRFTTGKTVRGRYEYSIIG